MVIVHLTPQKVVFQNYFSSPEVIMRYGQILWEKYGIITWIIMGY